MLGKKQNGISLIGTIIILLVFSALGVFLQSLNAMQHTSPLINFQEKRVHYVLESGIEWAKSLVLASGSCPSSGTSFTIENIDLTVNACVQAVITEGVNVYPVYTVNLSAETANRNFGHIDYAAKNITFQIK